MTTRRYPPPDTISTRKAGVVRLIGLLGSPAASPSRFAAEWAGPPSAAGAAEEHYGRRGCFCSGWRPVVGPFSLRPADINHHAIMEASGGKDLRASSRTTRPAPRS
jgi:hypothetical protein